MTPDGLNRQNRVMSWRLWFGRDRYRRVEYDCQLEIKDVVNLAIPVTDLVFVQWKPGSGLGKIYSSGGCTRPRGVTQSNDVLLNERFSFHVAMGVDRDTNLLQCRRLTFTVWQVRY